MDIIGITVFVLIFLIAAALVITTYVLRALGLYRLAANAKISAPWVAWLPIGDAYIMGSLSKKSPYIMKKFPRMNIIFPVLCAAGIALPIIFQIIFAFTIFTFDFPFSGNFDGGAIVAFILFYALLILYSLFLAAVYVLVYYHIYKAYDTQNAVLYTILSVFGLAFVFLFVIRNKVPSADIPSQLNPGITS